MDARARLFVALMLGRDLGRTVAEAVERALPGAGLRRYAAGDLHLTLHFLGATPREAVEPLSRELAAIAAAHGPFDLRLGRAGAFPARGRERVLWLAVDEARPGGLASLAADVSAAGARQGARAEDRPWRAHLTVARVGVRRARVPARFYELDPGLEWKPDALQLVESLAQGGAASAGRESYRALADFALASR